MIVRDEKGFTLIELLLATAILPLIILGASMTLIQTIKVSQRSNDRETAIRQVQNPGYWISRDVMMAENVVTDNLTPPDFLIITWTEWDDMGGDATYHKVTYSIEDLSDGIGKLKRTYWNSDDEVNQQTLVANYVYYNPDDPDNTSNVSYQMPVLTLRLTAHLGDTTETREYAIKRRPSL